MMFFGDRVMSREMMNTHVISLDVRVLSMVLCISWLLVGLYSSVEV
jgi:hypothetical protein